MNIKYMCWGCFKPFESDENQRKSTSMEVKKIGGDYVNISENTVYYCNDCTQRMKEDWNNKLNTTKKIIAGNDYQRLAARTMNMRLTRSAHEMHALHGMVGEIGELHSLYQKTYQGHNLDEEHAKKELGDLLWFVAEYCTARGWRLEDVMQMNIDKLKARYPEGFTENNSLHRAEGDI